VRYGVDYSKIDVEWTAFFRDLKASGYSFIGRYLPVQGAMQRRVTTAELTAAAAAGVDCFFWFENLDNIDRARDGYAAGVADAKEALRALASLGVPVTTPVYYTVDFNISDGSKIDAYFKGIASVVPVSQIGAYGMYTAIDWLYQHSLATYFCQTTAWIDGRGWHRQAQMHQNTSPGYIGAGVSIDRLTVTTPYFGQYRQGAMLTPDESASLPEGTSRLEQSDAHLRYSGTWYIDLFPGGPYSGVGYTHSTSDGASVTVAFTGKTLNWIARKNPAGGTATVSVDGGGSTLVSLDSPTTQFRQTVWSSGALTTGAHTVTITQTTGSLNVDAFDVIEEVASPVNPAEETNTALVYGGSWERFYASSASGSYYMRSSTPDATVKIPFNGRRLDVLCTKGATTGSADFSVDGRPVTTVDLANPTVQYRQKVWSTGDLPDGLHVVTITRSSRSAAGKYLTLDAVEVVGSLASATRFEQGGPEIGYTTLPAPWSTAVSVYSSGGSYKYTNATGSLAAISFDGCSASLICRKAANAGEMRIILDEGTPAEATTVVDLYSSGTLYEQKVWSSGLLPSGKHTVMIEWTGQKNALSNDTIVNVDAIDVIGGLR
jgi:hypothetical protein